MFLFSVWSFLIRGEFFQKIDRDACFDTGRKNFDAEACERKVATDIFVQPTTITVDFIAFTCVVCRMDFLLRTLLKHRRQAEGMRGRLGWKERWVCWKTEVFLDNRAPP